MRENITFYSSIYTMANNTHLVMPIKQLNSKYRRATKIVKRQPPDNYIPNLNNSLRSIKTSYKLIILLFKVSRNFLTKIFV